MHIFCIQYLSLNEEKSLPNTSKGLAPSKGLGNRDKLSSPPTANLVSLALLTLFIGKLTFKILIKNKTVSLHNFL